MRRGFVLPAAVVLLAGLGLGCGSDQDKGIFSNRDRPTAAPAAKPERPATAPRASEAEKPAATRKSSDR
jgi:hypothetical protein